MRYTVLGNSDLKVSTIGLGGAQYVYNKDLQRQNFVKLVRHAYDKGVRHFDTAAFYSTESFFGEGLKGIDRTSYVLSTKLGRYRNEAARVAEAAEFGTIFDFSAKRTEESFKKSLETLQVPYIDIIQVHDFEYLAERAVDTVISETLPVLQRFREQGLVRCIGLAAYHLPTIKTIIERSPIKIDTVLSHSSLTLIDQELVDYLPFFKERGIGIMNGSALAHGLLISKRPLPKWIKACEDLQAASNVALKTVQEAGMSLERLAVGYSYKRGQELGVDVFLTGADSIQVFDETVRVIEQGLTPAEWDMCMKLRNDVFEKLPLSNRNWGRNDVASYIAAQKKRRGIMSVIN